MDYRIIEAAVRRIADAIEELAEINRISGSRGGHGHVTEEGESCKE